MNFTPTDSTMIHGAAKDYIIAAQYLIGYWTWAILAIFLMIIFKDVLHQVAAGLAWKMGRRYNETDVVIVNGFFCRISSIGLLFTEFYIYDTIEVPPNQGWTWTVANDQLHLMQIWKPLAKHEKFMNSIQRITSTK